MIWKRFSIVFLLACSISLTGCLSHWFLESETRLQVENATEDLSIVAIDVQKTVRRQGRGFTKRFCLGNVVMWWLRIG